MEFTEVALSPVAPQLPDNHPIEWFGDAKRLFKGCMPPFVHQGAFGLRKRVIVAQWQDKKRSASEVVHRRWDRWHLVSTIDLNNQRYIVRGFSSELGGFRYHCWDGSVQDFGTYAVAYSWPLEVADRLEYSGETYESGSSLQGVEHVKRSKAQKSRPTQPMMQNYIIDGGVENDGQRQRTIAAPHESTSASDSLSTRNNCGQADPRESHRLDLSPTSSTVSRPRTTDIYAHEEGGPATAPTTFSDPWNSSPVLRRLAAISLPQAEQSYVFMSTSEPSKIGAGDHMTNTQQSGKRSHDQTRATETPSSVANYKRHHHDCEHNGDHDNPGKAINLNTPPDFPSPRPSLSSRPSQCDVEEPASTPARQTPVVNTIDAPLSFYKQRHTTLRMMLPFSTDFVPLRLSSCMTTASLFESAIAISGSGSQDLRIAGLRVTFDWKGEQDVDRAMLLKQEYSDSFEIFLETVDHAPCWSSDGVRCSVGIEVVLE